MALTRIFYLPANLFFPLLSASMAWRTLASLVLIEKRGVPILTLAHFPKALPQACLIPVWSLSRRRVDGRMGTCSGA